jgi:hypothetical protein
MSRGDGESDDPGGPDDVEDVDDLDELDRAVAAVYQGPLEEFVARRDALVAELRSAGRGDDATTVKRLRKPSRTAWALGAATWHDAGTVEALVDGVVDMVEAQSGEGDLRRAADQLRQSVHDYASAAARAAADAGHPVDPSLLAPAVMAVIGSVDAFDALRAGRLVNVPAGGGLDLLGGSLPMPRRSGARRPPRPAPEPAEPAPATARAVAAAREALAQAERAETEATTQADTAEQAVADSEAAVEAAEERLRQAEDDARASRARLRQVQQEAKRARQQLREATTAAAKARAKLNRLTD